MPPKQKKGEAKSKEATATEVREVAPGEKENMFEGDVFAPQRPPPLSAKEKFEGFKKFVGHLNEPNNEEVATGFFVTSAIMMFLPLIIFFAIRHYVAPVLLGPTWDPDVTGGLTAVASTVVITVVYGAWAIRRDARAEAAAAARKRQ